MNIFSKIDIAESTDTGSTGICHIKRLWGKAMKGNNFMDELVEEHELDNAVINILGLGLLPTYQFLFEQKPSLEDFEKWVLEKGGGIISDEIKKQCNQLFIPKSQTIEQADENLLTEEDINFWNEFGYIVLTNAISKEDCKEARDAIWNYLNMDEFDEASWYNNSSILQGVMVPLYRHPAIDKNRNSPKIRKAFEQLWGQKGLIVTTDKCGYNPPQKNGHIYRGIGLHWDVSLALPIPFGTQGILYLTDTTADQGALTLIPSFHNKIESWLVSLPENTHPREVDLSSFEKISIAANAGDFIIWIHKLPHSGSPNNANFPRLVQYINWFSPLQKTHEKWI